jgi:hypothetical protein
MRGFALHASRLVLVLRAQGAMDNPRRIGQSLAMIDALGHLGIRTDRMSEWADHASGRLGLQMIKRRGGKGDQAPSPTDCPLRWGVLSARRPA